jgi:hypothetical protein
MEAIVRGREVVNHDAERGGRVGNGVGHRRRRVDRAALRHPLKPLTLTAGGVSMWIDSMGGNLGLVATLVSTVIAVPASSFGDKVERAGGHPRQGVALLGLSIPGWQRPVATSRRS